MEKLFENILDKDEKIIKVFKPNKLKLFFSGFFSSFFILLFIIFPIATGLIVEESVDAWLAISIAVGGFLVLYGLIFLLMLLYYKKLYYAYSNKRIIIRTGVFGVDYKSLDMSMIGAVNVYVSLLDKILRKNTGSITFGSMASPMVAQSGGATGYKFSNIVLPYDTYKEVKSVIDEYKTKK